RRYDRIRQSTNSGQAPGVTSGPALTRRRWSTKRSAPFLFMKKCPICNRPIEWQDNPFRPFCSERCQLIDLGKWVSEEDRVPGRPVPGEHSEDDDDQAAPA